MCNFLYLQGMYAESSDAASVRRGLARELDNLVSELKLEAHALFICMILLHNRTQFVDPTITGGCVQIALA